MADRIEKLRATLAELEAELAELDSLDPASRARLQEVAGEISAALRRSDPDLKGLRMEPPHTIPERLSENVETFRAQYPTLAGIVQRLIDGLAQLGI
jgi:hypothetical protein